jgi:hypothetical protein
MSQFSIPERVRYSGRRRRGIVALEVNIETPCSAREAAERKTAR